MTQDQSAHASKHPPVRIDGISALASAQAASRRAGLRPKLARTGRRRSPAPVLDGSRPVAKVRRTVEKHGKTLGPPKTKYAARDVPLPHPLGVELRRHLDRRPEPPADAERRYGRLVFPSLSGTYQSEAAVPWRAKRATSTETRSEVPSGSVPGGGACRAFGPMPTKSAISGPVRAIS